jgi:hypothetical protein
MFDLDHPPIMLKGPTWVAPMIMGAGAFAVAVAAFVWWFTRSPLFGGMFLLAGVWVLGVGIAIRKMPVSLAIAPEGLTYRNLGVKRAWRWSDVDSFDTTHVKTAWLISFRDYAKDPKGRPFYLPSQWNAPRDAVVDLLRQAQARWGLRT